MSNKVEIRERFLNIRSMLNAKYKKKSNSMIAKKTIHFIKKYELKKVCFFLSGANEPDTNEIIKFCLKNNIEVYGPRAINSTNGMEFRQIKDLKRDTQRSNNGKFIEVKDTCAKLEDFSNLDTIFMPLVAFDRTLNRVGMGQGYYDLFINENNFKGYKIGLSQSTQLSYEKIEVEPHDVRLDFIITETEIFVPMINDETKIDEEKSFDVSYTFFNNEDLTNN